MSNRRKDTMDVREIVNQLRSGASDREISRDMDIARQTVKRYRAWAQASGVLNGALPSVERLQELLAQTMPVPAAPQNVSTVEPYRALVQELVGAEVEVAAIYQRLRERGFQGSYSGVYRFVRALKPRQPQTTVRVERKPGEEAQVDFGYAGLLYDTESGKLRRAWVFVMTLAWSRHQYVEFVWDQSVATWLQLHVHAFAFFGGVPQRIVPDNLKAAIIKASWDDPQVQYAYRECAEHYGFRIAPCRPRTPEHKGKVEQGGVHYVKRNFLGGRAATTLAQTNRDVRLWCCETAGQRIHGTTAEKPLARFEQVEKKQLQTLPATPYDLAVWKQVKLHRDCYVVFEGSFYSAPCRLVGQKLWLCAGARQVRLYTAHYELVATHERAPRPGERQTHPEHLPQEKLPGLLLNRETCLTTAAEVGAAATQVTQALLEDPVVERLPTVGRLLRLRERFGAERLEAACQRALDFSDPSYKTVKRILTAGLETTPQAAPLVLPAASTFARDTAELVGALVEVEAWN
jgi:transposase